MDLRGARQNMRHEPSDPSAKFLRLDGFSQRSRAFRPSFLGAADTGRFFAALTQPALERIPTPTDARSAIADNDRVRSRRYNATSGGARCSYVRFGFGP